MLLTALLPLLAAAPVAPEVSREARAVNGQSWSRVTLSAGVDGGAPATSTVWLYEPASLGPDRPVLLGLPGWKFEAMSWAERADVAALAEARGFALALADMNTTIYESAFYPETLPGYRWCGPDCAVPGLRWVGEVVLPWLRTRYQVAGVFGLSTGGRGAVLTAQAYPDIPRVCAMSGTYDLFALAEGSGEYRIHEVVYGSRASFPERWRADDSLSQIAKLDGVRALLIHGGADPAVSPDQSRALAGAPGVTVQIVAGAGHDWGLWSGQISACFDFFTAP